MHSQSANGISGGLNNARHTRQLKVVSGCNMLIIGFPEGRTTDLLQRYKLMRSSAFVDKHCRLPSLPRESQMHAEDVCLGVYYCTFETFGCHLPHWI
ncbi:hypothetical protein ABBQ32_009913 [Trebouxia sp. C0010 RCD-2024]